MGVAGCSQKNNNTLKAKFELGDITFFSKSKDVGEASELTLVTRFELKNDALSDDMSSYFQYQLGKNISLVIDNDTLQPSLSYYVPIIKENQKEIDCKYLLDKKYHNKSKRVIINEKMLGFEKINVLLK